MQNFTAHKDLKKRLSDSVKAGKLGHAYIFEGPEGVGKLSTALWFAKIAFCEKGGCGVCENCLKVRHGTHPDIHIIDEAFISANKGTSMSAKGQKEIKPGSVHSSRMAREFVYKKPFFAKRSFIIFPEEFPLNPAGQNAILKAFEEPPEYCTIIIICKTASSLLDTIRSRAVICRFSPLEEFEIKEYLSFRYPGSEDISFLCEGLMGKADELISSPSLMEEHRKIISAFENFIFSDGDMTGIVPLFDKDTAEDTIKLIECSVISKAKDCSDDEKALFYARITEILENAQLRLKKNINFNLCITDMLIKCWEATHG